MYDSQRSCEICVYCFQVFQNSQELKSHRKSYCVNKNSVLRIKYPSYGEFLKFKHFRKCTKIKFIAFFDFECIFKKISENQTLHKPIAFTCVIIDTEEEEIIAKNYIWVMIL